MRLLSIVLLVLLVTCPVHAQEEEEVIELGEDDFEVLDEEAGDVEEEGAGEDGPAGARRFVGRLHPAMTHFGIAWAALAFPFALARTRWKGLGRADLAVVAAALSGSSAAALTGWMHAPDVMSRPGVELLVEIHQWTAFGVVGLLAAALVLRIVMDGNGSRPLKAVYLVLLALVLGLVLFVGHMGGKITFGEDFLF